jgi:hypothetical protein
LRLLTNNSAAEEGDDKTEQYSWNDLKDISGKTSNKPQTVYFACMALAGVSLVLSILVSCFIFCCLMRRSARHSLEESCGNCPKWSIFLASLLSFITAVAAWGALFAFPSALDDIDFLKCNGSFPSLLPLSLVCVELNAMARS